MLKCDHMSSAEVDDVKALDTWRPGESRRLSPRVTARSTRRTAPSNWDESSQPGRRSMMSRGSRASYKNDAHRSPKGTNWSPRSNASRTKLPYLDTARSGYTMSVGDLNTNRYRAGSTPYHKGSPASSVPDLPRTLRPKGSARRWKKSVAPEGSVTLPTSTTKATAKEHNSAAETARRMKLSAVPEEDPMEDPLLVLKQARRSPKKRRSEGVISAHYDTSALSLEERRVKRAQKKVLARVEAEAVSDRVGGKLLRVFRKFGPDKFGQLSKQAFVQGIARNFRVAPSDAELLFQKADVDGNGMVSCAEFRKVFAEVGAKAHAEQPFSPKLFRAAEPEVYHKHHGANMWKHMHREHQAAFTELSLEEKQEYRERAEIREVIRARQADIKSAFQYREEKDEGGVQLHTRIPLQAAANKLRSLGVEISAERFRELYRHAADKHSNITFSELASHTDDYFNKVLVNAEPVRHGRRRFPQNNGNVDPLHYERSPRATARSSHSHSRSPRLSPRRRLARDPTPPPGTKAAPARRGVDGEPAPRSGGDSGSQAAASPRGAQAGSQAGTPEVPTMQPAPVHMPAPPTEAAPSHRRPQQSYRGRAGKATKQEARLQTFMYKDDVTSAAKPAPVDPTRWNRKILNNNKRNDGRRRVYHSTARSYDHGNIITWGGEQPSRCPSQWSVLSEAGDRAANSHVYHKE